VITIKKKNFLLTNKIDNYNIVYKIIIKKIPRSIFSKLQYKFFKNMVNSKIIEVFLIKKKKNEISGIVSVITIDNYRVLKKKIFSYLLKSPSILFKEFFFFISLLARGSININLNNKKNYLHLLHLVIFKNKYKNISLINKDKVVNFFFNKIVKKYNAKYLYLCYEKDNLNAFKFYNRNKFKVYARVKSTIFVKKFFK